MSEEREIDRNILHKEIDLIQACITRMAHNSFLIKGWTITLVAVVLALAEKVTNPVTLCLTMLVPLLSFWYLDAFFLYTEKLYRKLYEWVIVQRRQGNDEKLYDLNSHRFKDELKQRKWNKQTRAMEATDKQETVWSVMRSVTLRCFYGIPAVIVIAVLVFYLHANSTHGKAAANGGPKKGAVATATQQPGNP